MANKSVGLLTIAFGADLRGFDKALKKGLRSTQKFANNMKRTGQTITKSVTLPLIAFAGVSVKAFDEQIKAETKLRTALGGSETAFQNLKKQAQELQKTTLFGDEATIEAAAFLGQLGLQEDAISQLLPLIQDFATAQNMQLGDAAKLVAKSVGSSTNALSRYGITIEGQVGTTDRLESATNALTTAFGGTAKAVAGEGLGAWVQLKNALGDVSEEFGKIILENLEPLKARLSEVAERLKNLSAEQKENILKWMKWIAIIGPAIVILGTVLSTLVSVVSGIRNLGLALMWLNANPIGAIITAIGAFITALVWLLTSSSDTARKVRNFFIIMANGIILSINKAIDAINFLNPFDQIKHFKLFKLEAKKELEEVGKEAQKASDKVGEIGKNLPTGGPTAPTQVDMGEDSGGGATEDPLDAKKKEFQEQVTLYKNMLQESINADKENYLKGIIQKEDYLSRVKDAEENHLLLMKDLYAAYGEHILDIDRQILDGKIANMEEETTTTMNLKDALISAGESVANQMAQGAENMGAFAELAKGAIKDVIGGLIAQGVAAAVTSAMTSTAATGQVWLIPIVAKIASGLAKTAFNSLLPSFAEGGIVSKPMIAQVGDAPSGPEVIAPLDKLKSMMGDTKQEVEVVGRIAGDDIWLSNKKTGFNRFRSV